MPRSLPERPDLAREHGFASWPRLKAEVERLQQPATEPQAAGRPAGKTTVSLRILGHRLPGLRWSCYEAIHVGVQRQHAAVPPTLVRGDAEEATFRPPSPPRTPPTRPPPARPSRPSST